MDFKCECGRIHTIKVETLKCEPKILRPLKEEVVVSLEGCDVSIGEAKGKIIIRKNALIPDDMWRFVMDYVKVNGGQWITDGSNSRWEI